MNFIAKIFSKKESNSPLLGDWFSDLNDGRTASEMGDIKMSFNKNGNLIYEINETDKKQIINLTFVIRGNKLITDQPSHPKKEETEFYFDEINRLVLKFQGEETRFIRERL
jgi:hypothetical protein